MSSNITNMKFQRHFILPPAECTQICNSAIMKKGWTFLGETLESRKLEKQSNASLKLKAYAHP